MRDNTGRNIDYLRVSVTDRCNLRCRYCMPESGVTRISHSEVLAMEEILALTEIIDSVLNLRKIRITGGEPLVRKGVVPLVAQLSQICETVITTNGILLPEYAEELALAGLSRVNISIDSLRDDVLRRVTRRNLSLGKIREAIAAAKRNGLGPVKVNCVALEGINTGEFAEMVQWAADEDVVIRFIEHMPMTGSICGYFPGDSILRAIESDLGPLSVLGTDGTARMYLTSRGQSFGLISPVSADLCAGCSRLRLTVDGNLLPCLAGGHPLDLRYMIRAGLDREVIAGKIAELVAKKPPKGNCGGVRMWRIGG